MYYLRCKHCNYLNDLLDENVIFCINCTKKLDNNYNYWKHCNSDNSFDKFKNEICEYYTDDNVELVFKNNEKHKKTDLTKDEIYRKKYIEAGIPLDRGGFYEWTFPQLWRYILFMALIFGLLFLIVYFLT